jgi:hypothetical protein
VTVAGELCRRLVSWDLRPPPRGGSPFPGARWFGDVCQWRNVVTTVLVHVLLLILVW